MDAVYTVDVKCLCIEDSNYYNIHAGETFAGRVELGRTSAPLFIVKTKQGEQRFLHAQFTNYFVLIK
jgi:hypothetical protein